MNDRLCIIGNGFDLHHKLKCSFADFRDWLKSNEMETYMLMRKYYEDVEKVEWWSHFEESIGDFNMVFPPHSSNIGNLYAKLDKAFFLWIKDLNSAPVLKDMSLNMYEDAKYLNFNYTNTLTTIYGVNPNQILHIHGDVTHNEKLIFGGRISNGRYHVIREDVIGDFLDGDIFEVDKVVCSHNKNVYDIIERHTIFFEELKSVSDVTVYGFSFSQIDMPYIVRIVEASPNATWKVYIHSDADLKRVECVKNTCKIVSNGFEIIRW